MLISPAYAQAAGEAGGGDLFLSLMPLALIFVVFYFLMIRPQQKKMKAHKEMLSSVKRGDRIVTGGGIVGRVARVEDDELVVEIASDVKVRLKRGHVSELISRAEPASAESEDEGRRSKKRGKKSEA
jgi:preprotein translocase subunit YajC